MDIVVSNEPCQHGRLAYGPTTGQVGCLDCNRLWWPWQEGSDAPVRVIAYYVQVSKQEARAKAGGEG